MRCSMVGLRDGRGGSGNDGLGFFTVSRTCVLVLDTK